MYSILFISFNENLINTFFEKTFIKKDLTGTCLSKGKYYYCQSLRIAFNSLQIREAVTGDSRTDQS